MYRTCIHECKYMYMYVPHLRSLEHIVRLGNNSIELQRVLFLYSLVEGARSWTLELAPPDIDDNNHM